MPESSADHVVSAAHTLAALGYVGAFGHVSVRDGQDMVITPAGDLAFVTAEEVLRIPLGSTRLPQGAAGESWLHLAIYGARADVGAVVRATPDSAFAAGAVSDGIRPMHGQAAWLGHQVPVHPVSLLQRTGELADAVVGTLAGNYAVVLRGNGAVTVAESPGQAVARMSVLDTTCRLAIAAMPAGTDVHYLSDSEIVRWQQPMPALLERLWVHLRDRRTGPAARTRVSE